MPATKVIIVRVEEQSHVRAEKFILLLSAFILGIFLGALIVFAKNGQLVLPYISARTQLGAIGAVESETVNILTAVTPETALLANPEVTTASIEEISAQKDIAEKITRDEKISDLKLRITDREIALVRLNQEIERVKNSSVALIAVFQQNCGSWNDDCAKNYSGTLESYNAKYTELVSQMLPLESELTSLKERLSVLE